MWFNFLLRLKNPKKFVTNLLMGISIKKHNNKRHRRKSDITKMKNK